ncbi:MAG: hypothetical protein KGI47_04195 [Betaproteobacteria bacterium]|nr:hypothetical protein [Betaproteobacteria bacterium]MDE2621762.1 hypothetical protein [Betaproteobacteria bacterium]
MMNNIANPLKNKHIHTSATLVAVWVMLAGAGAHAESGGWFSGISALPFTMQMESGNAFDGSAFSSNRSAWSHHGETSLGEVSGAPRNSVLGGSGTLSLSDRFGFTGKLSSMLTSGDVTANSVTHGLANALPYNMMGLGLKYDVTHSLRFQGGWDRYQLKYNRINGDTGVDLLTLGLKYGF